ncbi:MAG: precorrin-4 C(11)-methyltransferase [Phocaeicola sp.]|uniref:precorrin-4 C(11)-methyltransferase n=1 Tax=Phocaeicola sp. TaxID=2773926 RepID=UPI003F9FC976
MKAAVILISEAGYETAQSIHKEYKFPVYSLHKEQETIYINNIDELLKVEFHHFEAFIFIGAMGICVRSIASYIEDKHTDPAILCIDCNGQSVISVLSGHIGGANELAKQVAATIGATPVITTQSDKLGLWALDTLAKRFNWYVNKQQMNKEISLFTSGKSTALLLSIRDKGTEWMEANLPANVKVFYHYEDIQQNDYSLLLIVSPFTPRNIHIPYLIYAPKCLHIGIGLAHQAEPVEEILKEMESTLNEHGISKDTILDFSTINEKKDEPVVKRLQQTYPILFYAAKELKEVNVPNPSSTVKKYMNTYSVSEASAILSADNEKLIINKTKGKKWTLAASIDYKFLRQGHIEIIGAGPGDPDLISVRGRKMLEKADLILYAGSLVPRELTECAKLGATVKSSASLDLEEQIDLMKKFYDKGKLVVRLHTGDPCLYGAIQEQMNFFDKYHMNYHITPGISAFQAAAAELRSQFTIPRKVQTIILTRGEGRTLMPEKEKLHLLARSQSTMCIYLSADIVEKVQAELLQEYPETTPVAACYRLTWKEQRIYRGQLKDLNHLLRDNNLTLDTLIVVGDAIDNRQGLSELYSSHFTHLFRKAKE